MDGFYVAKIQKLSDKRKGEEEKKKEEAEQAAGEKVEDDAKDGKKKADEGKAGVKKKQKGKKRGNASKDEIVNDDGKDETSRPHKKSKISYAPNVQAQSSKKKKTNAKMTKPRRMKITGM